MHQHSRVFIAVSKGQKLIIGSKYSKEVQVSRHRFQLVGSEVT